MYCVNYNWSFTQSAHSVNNEGGTLQPCKISEKSLVSRSTQLSIAAREEPGKEANYVYTTNCGKHIPPKGSLNYVIAWESS